MIFLIFFLVFFLIFFANWCSAWTEARFLYCPLILTDLHWIFGKSIQRLFKEKSEEMLPVITKVLIPLDDRLVCELLGQKWNDY